MNRPLASLMSLNTHIAIVLFALATSPIDWILACSFLLQSPLHERASRRTKRRARAATAKIHDFSAHQSKRKAG